MSLPAADRRAQRAAGEASAQGAEIVPLSQRVAAMMVFRVAETALLLVIGLAVGRQPAAVNATSAGVYLAVTGLASLAGRWSGRTVALRLFGAALLVDGVYLQVQHELLGPRLSVDVAMAAQLSAVCLLVSFRSGLKLAIWETVLLLFALKAHASRLLPSAPPGPTVPAQTATQALAALLWLVVLTTCAAAAVNERELRRRRYDAEALAGFATALHQLERPDQVMTRVLGFVVEELQATRGLVVHESAGSVSVVAGHRLARDAPTRTAAGHSALLDLASRTGGAALALRLDAELDPWLDAAMPQGRRLVAIPLDTAPDARNWLVFEHAVRSGSRVERRLVSSATQAAATAALAVSRATLLQRAELAAATDGLTGVANRRTFDAAMQGRASAWARHGRATALVLIDVDHFKLVNDRHGHPAGDEVLRILGGMLTAAVRSQDLAARYGGEEFALVLPDTTAAQAVELADRLRVALHDVAGPVRISASFGVASLPDDATDIDALVAAADDALSHAKNTGRDRVVAAASVPERLRSASAAGGPTPAPTGP